MDTWIHPTTGSWIMCMCMNWHMDVRRALPVATTVDSFWVVSAFYHAICKSWAGCQLSMLCSSCPQPKGKLSVLLVPPRAWGCVCSTHLFHTPMPFAHFFLTTDVFSTLHQAGFEAHDILRDPPTMLKNQPNASGPTLTMGTGEHGWAGWRGRSDSSASDLGVPRLVDSELCAWEVKARPWTPLLWVLLWLWAEPASLPG